MESVPILTDILSLIGIIFKDILPVIASLGNMMNHTLKDNPCSPGHPITSQNERLAKNRD